VSDQFVGRVHRGQLGVAIQLIDHELAKQFGVKPREGVLVAEVVKDSPAEKAGLKQQDIILKYAGEPIETPAELQREVERAKVGSPQKVVVLRDGKRVTLTVRSRELKEEVATTSGGNSKSPSGSLGFEVQTLTDELSSQLGVENTEGVVVSSVDRGSKAADAGLRAGMVVTQVNRSKVKSVEQFEEEIKKSDPKKGILLLVKTGEGTRFLVVPRG
jgi:serine protease Do